MAMLLQLLRPALLLRSRTRSTTCKNAGGMEQFMEALRMQQVQHQQQMELMRDQQKQMMEQHQEQLKQMQQIMGVALKAAQTGAAASASTQRQTGELAPIVTFRS